jgi:hypothetical protein
MRLPFELREALDKTGLPWEIELGSKHHKVKLCGKLVAVFPRGKKHEAEKRSLLNTISQVRNAARQLKEIS